jgi:hypothetical protein
MDFKKIIEMWPNYIALATDLDEVPSTVRKWHERNRVPARVWPAMEKAGRKRGYKISVTQLMELYMESNIKGKRGSKKTSKVTAKTAKKKVASPPAPAKKVASKNKKTSAKKKTSKKKASS